MPTAARWVGGSIAALALAGCPSGDPPAKPRPRPASEDEVGALFGVKRDQGPEPEEIELPHGPAALALSSAQAGLVEPARAYLEESRALRLRRGAPADAAEQGARAEEILVEAQALVVLVDLDAAQARLDETIALLEPLAEEHDASAVRAAVAHAVAARVAAARNKPKLAARHADAVLATTDPLLTRLDFVEPMDIAEANANRAYAYALLARLRLDRGQRAPAKKAIDACLVIHAEDGIYDPVAERPCTHAAALWAIEGKDLEEVRRSVKRHMEVLEAIEENDDASDLLERAAFYLEAGIFELNSAGGSADFARHYLLRARDLAAKVANPEAADLKVAIAVVLAKVEPP